MMRRILLLLLLLLCLLALPLPAHAALVVVDRVAEISTTTGTGAITLAGATANHVSFNAAIGVGNTTYYAIIARAPVTQWEVGLGTLSGATTLTRTTPYSTWDGTTLCTTGCAALSFSAGTKDVFVTNPARTSGTTITGTANQIIASAPAGAVTLSLPQSIATTSTPTFGGLNTGMITLTTPNGFATTTNQLLLTQGGGTEFWLGRNGVTGHIVFTSAQSPATTRYDFDAPITSEGGTLVKQGTAAFVVGAGLTPATGFRATDGVAIGTADMPAAGIALGVASGNDYTFVRHTGTGALEIRGRQTTASFYSWFVDSTREILRFANSGNVGIGIEAPAAALHVSRGTTPTGLLIDNTWTNASNYERGFVRWTGNAFYIGTEGLGTGAATPRPLVLTAGAWSAVLSGSSGAFTVPANINISNAGGASTGLSTASTSASSYATTDWTNNVGYAAQMLLGGSTFSNGIFTSNSASFYTTGPGGLLLGASDTAGIIRFFTGGFTVGDERFRIGASGQLLSVPKALSGTPSTAGSYVNIATATFTDSATAGSGTAASFAAHAFQAPTLAATNASVTTTKASTVYISGPVIAGTNQTITTPRALTVATGNLGVDSGTITASGGYVSGSSAGLASQTLTVCKGVTCAGGDQCTVTITGGLVTASTC